MAGVWRVALVAAVLLPSACSAFQPNNQVQHDAEQMQIMAKQLEEPISMIDHEDILAIKQRDVAGELAELVCVDTEQGHFAGEDAICRKPIPHHSKWPHTTVFVHTQSKHKHCKPTRTITRSCGRRGRPHQTTAVEAMMKSNTEDLDYTTLTTTHTQEVWFFKPTTATITGGCCTPTTTHPSDEDLIYSVVVVDTTVTVDRLLPMTSAEETTVTIDRFLPSITDVETTVTIDRFLPSVTEVETTVTINRFLPSETEAGTTVTVLARPSSFTITQHAAASVIYSTVDEWTTVTITASQPLPSKEKTTITAVQSYMSKETTTVTIIASTSNSRWWFVDPAMHTRSASAYVKPSSATSSTSKSSEVLSGNSVKAPERTTTSTSSVKSTSTSNSTLSSASNSFPLIATASGQYRTSIASSSTTLSVSLKISTPIISSSEQNAKSTIISVASSTANHAYGREHGTSSTTVKPQIQHNTVSKNPDRHRSSTISSSTTQHSRHTTIILGSARASTIVGSIDNGNSVEPSISRPSIRHTTTTREEKPRPHHPHRSTKSTPSIGNEVHHTSQASRHSRIESSGQSFSMIESSHYRKQSSSSVSCPSTDHVSSGSTEMPELHSHTKHSHPSASSKRTKHSRSKPLCTNKSSFRASTGSVYTPIPASSSTDQAKSPFPRHRTSSTSHAALSTQGAGSASSGISRAQSPPPIHHSHSKSQMIDTASQAAISQKSGHSYSCKTGTSAEGSFGKHAPSSATVKPGPHRKSSEVLPTETNTVLYSCEYGAINGTGMANCTTVPAYQSQTVYTTTTWITTICPNKTTILVPTVYTMIAQAVDTNTLEDTTIIHPTRYIQTTTTLLSTSTVWETVSITDYSSQRIPDTTFPQYSESMSEVSQALDSSDIDLNGMQSPRTDDQDGDDDNADREEDQIDAEDKDDDMPSSMGSALGIVETLWTLTLIAAVCFML